MNVPCPHCKSRSEFDAEVTGRVVDCPICNEPFRVPSPDDDQRSCPNCGDPMDETAIVCVGCGFSFKTGAALGTTITVEREGLPAWNKTLNLFVDAAPGLFRPVLLLAAITCFVLSIALGMLGLLILGFGAGFAGIAIMAFGLICYAQSVALILSGSFLPLNQAMVEFESVHWYIFTAVVLGPFVGIVAYLAYFAPPIQAQ